MQKLNHMMKSVNLKAKILFPLLSFLFSVQLYAKEIYFFTNNISGIVGKVRIYSGEEKLAEIGNNQYLSIHIGNISNLHLTFKWGLRLNKKIDIDFTNKDVAFIYVYLDPGVWSVYEKYYPDIPYQVKAVYDQKKKQTDIKPVQNPEDVEENLQPKDEVSLTADVDENIPEDESNNENEYAFALIIGNEDYSSQQTDISNEMNVAYAINDTKIFKEYCLKTLGIPEKNITYLVNATSGKILQAINKTNKLIQVTNGKAKVIVYYAGHGLPDEVTKEPYLIPVDVSGTDVQSGGIKLSYLYSKLTEFPAQQVTVFLDACFSGGGRESGLLAARGVKVKPKDDYLKGNIVVFTASSGEESSLPYSEKQHGMFTYFLLKKLQDSKGDVSFSELSNYLKEKVELESVRTNSKNQSPQTLMSEELRDSWGGLRLK